MSLPQRKPLVTIEDYLRLERDALDKHEFYRGEIFCMAGGSARHSLLISNATREIGNRLKGGKCRVYDSNLRVRIPASDLYTYPDALVICGQVKFDALDRRGETALNPTLLVEVLSPSTEGYDRGLKAQNYRTIESLQEYVLVAQDAAVVETYHRQPDGSWLLRTFRGRESEARLASLGIDLPLAEIYDGIEFPLSERASPTEELPAR
jgi:Uma2 family endonuclease